MEVLRGRAVAEEVPVGLVGDGVLGGRAVGAVELGGRAVEVMLGGLGGEVVLGGRAVELVLGGFALLSLKGCPWQRIACRSVFGLGA